MHPRDLGAGYLWEGANKDFRTIQQANLDKEQLEAPKSEEQWRKKNVREQKKREKKAWKKAKKLQELVGVDIKPVMLGTASKATCKILRCEGTDASPVSMLQDEAIILTASNRTASQQQTAVLASLNLIVLAGFWLGQERAT